MHKYISENPIIPEHTKMTQKPVIANASSIKKTPSLRELLLDHRLSNFSEDVEDELTYFRICPNFGDDIKIVFVVTSSPDHPEARDTVRRTWGALSSRRDLAIAFILGYPKDKKIAQKIENEQRIYGDLIRGKFLDTYDNLTLKTTWIMQWVSKYCTKATYGVKIDDDVFLNVDLLLRFINQGIIRENRTIYGSVKTDWRPVRDENDKYYISKYQFEPDVFPHFTTGPAYMFPIKLAVELYNEAQKLPYVKLEDVFYTGIVSSRLNISRIDIPEFVNNFVEFEDCLLKKTITVHGTIGEYMTFVWYRINAVQDKDCKNSTK